MSGPAAPLPAARAARASAALARLAAAAREDRAILAFLAVLLLGLILLADRSSYWYDELLSVDVYGLRHATPYRMVLDLANNSVHPPLYQLVLYAWMTVFGESEAATRALSSVYAVLAALFLYGIVKAPWGRAIAFASAAGFAVMGATVLYALEARSYAQTMLLVTVSSWLLLRLLAQRADPAVPVRRGRLQLAALIAVNTALMLTHYYNVFWLIAQAAFLLVHLAVARPRPSRRAGLGVLLLVGGVPQLLFAASWGAVLLRQYLDLEERFGTEGAAEQGPVELLTGLIGRNLAAPTAVLVALGAGVLAMLVASLGRLVRARGAASERAAWGYLYLVVWLVVPLVVVYAVFSLAGVERYHPRYFLFAVPPLAPLVVIAVVAGLQRGWRWLRRQPSAAAPLAPAVAGLLIAALALPGGLAAAGDRKQDWRGVAQELVDIVHGDPVHRYVVVEASFGGPSRIDFYLERLSDDVRSELRPQRREEAAGDYSALLAELPEPGSGERVALVLVHHTAADFPRLIELLDERYSRILTGLDGKGEGLVVYAAEPAPGGRTG